MLPLYHRVEWQSSSIHKHKSAYPGSNNECNRPSQKDRPWPAIAIDLTAVSWSYHVSGRSHRSPALLRSNSLGLSELITAALLCRTFPLTRVIFLAVFVHHGSFQGEKNCAIHSHRSRLLPPRNSSRYVPRRPCISSGPAAYTA